MNSFEIGRYYRHSSGYLIHVLSEIKTVAGKRVIVEALDAPVARAFSPKDIADFSSATEKEWLQQLDPPTNKKTTKEAEFYVDLGRAEGRDAKKLIGQVQEFYSEWLDRDIRAKIIKAYVPKDMTNLFVDIEPVEEADREVPISYYTDRSRKPPAK